jgi:hypothetical protein
VAGHVADAYQQAGTWRLLLSAFLADDQRARRVIETVFLGLDGSVFHGSLQMGSPQRPARNARHVYAPQKPGVTAAPRRGLKRDRRVRDRPLAEAVAAGSLLGVSTTGTRRPLQPARP